MGQGNTIVSHFVVQRANLIIAIACVHATLLSVHAHATLLSVHASEDFGSTENWLPMYNQT